MSVRKPRIAEFSRYKRRHQLFRINPEASIENEPLST